MLSDKRIVEGYEITQTFEIGKAEIVLGEKPNAPDNMNYLIANCENNGIFTRYNDVLIGDDFAELAKIFAERIAAEATRVMEENAKISVDKTPLTAKDCELVDYSQSIKDKSDKEKLKEITDSIENGIKELFASDKYKQYLQTMSRFHRYSVNNQMLIFMQKPDASLVAGFNKWKDSFGRNVKRGEKGIKIIAPAPFKKKIEKEKLDPDTKLPMLDENGQPIKEVAEVSTSTFKVVSVFDVSQTEGKPLPELSSDLTGNVEHYDAFMEAIKRSSPVPIDFKPIENGADGFFSYDNQSITLREGMSEIQTVCAAIHEMAHATLHNYSRRNKDETDVERKDRHTEEVEAESIAYAVCAYYGIETGDNSFGYLASWSSDKELKELKASLETINKTSSELI